MQDVLIRLAENEFFLDPEGKAYSCEQIDELVFGTLSVPEYYIPRYKELSPFETKLRAGGFNQLFD